MTKRFLVFSASAVVGLICAGAQAQVAPPRVAAPRVDTPEEIEAARRALAQRQADRAEMEAREAEALSRPASWAPMSLDELEKSLGGRTMIEVRAKDATLDNIAALVRQQSGLDVFTQGQILPPFEGQGRPASSRQETYSFDISKRPLWEAVRAMSIAEAARQSAARSGTVVDYGGRSIFNDMGSPRGELFSRVPPSFFPSLTLSPVQVTRPSVREISLASPFPNMTPEQQAQRVRQMQAPRLEPSSPRQTGVLWQLGNAFGYQQGGDIARGRSYAAWPCLFVADYIARQQDNYLAPDASEAAPAVPAADAKADAKAPAAGEAKPPAPQVLVRGGRAPSEPTPLGIWKQSVALQMRAYIDPRLNGYRNVRLVVDEASDEAGRDLRRADFARPRRVPLGKGADLPLPIALELPRERGDKLRLRGAILLWVPARITTTEFPLGDDGTAARQAIFWGQEANMKMKLSQGENNSWLLASEVEMKRDRGQLDFRREMSTALNDDDGYRAGLILPGSVRVQSADGREWKLQPFSEEQKLSLNAGVDMLSRKTDFMGAFRRARTANGSFEGQTSGNGAGYSASGDLVTSRSSLHIGSSSIAYAIGQVPVPPDGYAYSENVTWQLAPSTLGIAGAPGATGAAGGAADAPPALSKILFDTPQEWREVRVPFEFKDLPLPPR